MIHMIGLVLIAILAENMVLVRCLGMSWPGKTVLTEESAWRMGVSITLVMVVTALLSWLVNTFVLKFFGVEHLRILFYVLLVLGSVELVRQGLRLFFPVLHRNLNEYLSQVVYNCAVLGVAFLINLRSYSLGQSLLYALASGVGVLGVLVIFTGMQDQASFDYCPKVFRGLPIQLITAGLMAMALMGFYGLNVT
ncbi:MAG: hypothetical protein E7440_06305 [Ruminococcaceae bacterium]|nr:hypothetical protein [Oscillospiraceae bacterium]